MFTFLSRDLDFDVPTVNSIYRRISLIRALFVTAIVFSGSLLFGYESAYAATSTFAITVDIAENSPWNVGYRGGTICITCSLHGWRISVIADYENESNPADHLLLNLQLMNDGSYTPYGNPRPMDFTSIGPLDFPSDFTRCAPTDPYYDRYRVAGFAENELIVSDRTYVLQEFDYSVSTLTTSSKSIALNDIYAKRSTDNACCRYYWTTCTNCSQILAVNSSATAAIVRSLDRSRPEA